MFSGNGYRYAPALLALAALGFAAPTVRAGHDDDDCDRPRSRFSFGFNFGHGGLDVRVSRGGHHRHCRHHAGHYVERTERVCVQRAHYEERWVPAVYEIRYDDCGRRFRVCVREGYYEEVYIPARYETRCVRVWVPERWECHNGCGHRRGHGHGRRDRDHDDDDEDDDD